MDNNKCERIFRKKVTENENQSSILENQKGFALVILAVLMPLILAALAFLYVSTTQIEIRSTLLQTCRNELIQTQEKSASLIKSLMSLNKLVDIIKWSLFIAKLLSLASLANPMLAVLIKSVLAIANSSSKVISILQKTIIYSLWITMENDLIKLQSQLRQILKSYSKKTKDLMLISTQLIIGNLFREISVEAEKPNEKITKYRLKKEFSEKQKLYVRWRYNVQLAPTLTQWIDLNQNFNGFCGVSLRKEEPWIPILYADKFYWKL